ncbi:MAG: alpha/beta fold hydrolase [Devosia sp.]
MAQLVTDDGVAIVYDDLGPRDGVPIVLCHGLAAAGEQLEADAHYFAGLGYRVLVPDLRGHGRSGKPAPLSAAGFSIPRMAADLVAMLDDAGVDPVHWVGNSLGGILALELLPRQPARFRTLATFGTAYRLSLPRWGARFIPLGYALFGPRLIAGMTAWGTTRAPSARPLIEKLVARFDPQVGRCVAENLSNYDLIANAVAATLPILMLRGGRDAQVNAALGPTLKAMQGRPNFALVEVPEGGHCANLDATEVWRTELLKFWRRH